MIVFGASASKSDTLSADISETRSMASLATAIMAASRKSLSEALHSFLANVHTEAAASACAHWMPAT